MLKPVDQGPPPKGEAERPIGELVHQLVEDGKAYARAEAGVVQAIATAKAKGLAWPAGLFLAALIVLQSAVTMLAFGFFAALVLVMPAILAAVIASLIFVAIAGLMAWLGVRKAQELL